MSVHTTIAGVTSIGISAIISAIDDALEAIDAAIRSEQNSVVRIELSPRRSPMGTPEHSMPLPMLLAWEALLTERLGTDCTISWTVTPHAMTIHARRQP